MSRVDQYSVTVVIGTTPTGVWDHMTGGGIASSETKYRPGAMAQEISLGGRKSVENVTVDRLYLLERDHELARWAMTRAGRDDCTVTKQPLDVDGNPWGAPIIYRGKLMNVNTPDPNSSSQDAALWSIVVSTVGDVA